MPQENLTLYKVFLASPSDVVAERAVAFEVINELNQIYESQGKDYRLEIRAWENHSHPDLGLPQEVIKRQISIEKCDIFIGLFGKRFGASTGSVRSSSGKPYLSRTQQEIEEAIAAREASVNQRPIILLYRKLDPSPVDMGDEDYLQYAKVIEFFRQCKPGGEHPALVGEFKEGQFQALLKRHLLQVLADFEIPQSHQTIMSINMDTTALRVKLQQFDSVDIESLCLDNFPVVYDKFARGLRHDEMLNLLLAHCRRNPEDAARLADVVL